MWHGLYLGSVYQVMLYHGLKDHLLMKIKPSFVIFDDNHQRLINEVKERLSCGAECRFYAAFLHCGATHVILLIFHFPTNYPQ